VQPARRSDILAIEATGWREADEHECVAASGNGCTENCFLALDAADNETYTIMNEGYPVGMFGVVPLVGMGIPPGWGTVWLLAAHGLYGIRRDFLRQCTNWIDHLQRFYPCVTNFVHVENRPAIAWCQYVGFNLGPVQKYGVAGEHFMQITRSL
jgi:hypothetical protein